MYLKYNILQYTECNKNDVNKTFYDKYIHAPNH